MRLTFEPRSFAQKLFRARLRLKTGNTLSLHSVNFRSMVFADRQEEAYAAFMHAMLPRIAKANPKARFVVGRSPFTWAALCIATAGILAAIAFFIWFAWSEGETAAARDRRLHRHRWILAVGADRAPEQTTQLRPGKARRPSFWAVEGSGAPSGGSLKHALTGAPCRLNKASAQPLPHALPSFHKVSRSWPQSSPLWFPSSW